MKKFLTSVWMFPVLFFLGAALGLSVALVAIVPLMKTTQTVATTTKDWVYVNIDPPLRESTSTSELVPEWSPSTSTVDMRPLTIDVRWEDPYSVPVSRLLAGMSDRGTISNTFGESLVVRGVVTGGPYRDYRLVYGTIPCDGMCLGSDMAYLLVNQAGTKIIFIGPYQGYNSYLDPHDPVFSFVQIAPSSTIRFPGAPPEALTFNGKILKLLGKADVYGTILPHQACSPEACTEFSVLGRSSEGFKIFNDSRNLPAVIDAAGFLYEYEAGLPLSDTNGNVRFSVFSGWLQWNAAYSNTSTYVSMPPSYGCNVLGYGYGVDTDEEVGPMSGLVQAGTANSLPMYVPKNLRTSSQVLAVYDMWMQYDDVGQKPSLDVFLRRYKAPVFFVRDVFNRWIEYRIAEAVPLAECGKPVIYLYPQTTTNVSVKLPSFIHVTKSEPAYPSQGWNVTAKPSGQLTMKDGATYGSLFWEGTGVSYDRPTTGFIIRDGEVDARLKTILAKYGLNETESREFREFWVPKMTGAKYYRVSFVTDAWSRAAPLAVTPKPDTNIRIFMDWSKLGAPVSLPEPKVVTPQRNGFTLVEWGGVLYGM